ncbi:MAG TPA: nucleic acid-binding protein [Candidatus Atribacteria bacterium]|nr:nucleic acid-binding protein [Candidatus Atribacteria bacterium]
MMLTVQNYVNGLKDNKILGTKCKNCGNIMIPLKPVCSKCGSFDVEEFETKGKGVIRSFTVIYVAPEKFKDKVPYVVAIINLDEGGAIMGRLTGVDPNKPENIKVGTKVKFEALVEGEEVVVVFRVDN